MSTTTGQCSPEFIKNTSGTPINSETSDSLRENLKKWYLAPLARMEKDEAFVCLCACFPIYEKFLRASEKIAEEEKFSEGHRVFNFLGSKWGCSSAVAYAVWNNWRNGLLHRAMVKKDEKFTFFMDGAPEFDRPVNERGTEIILNPWKFRDCLFSIIDGKREIWKDDDHPFMRIYRGEV